MSPICSKPEGFRASGCSISDSRKEFEAVGLFAALNEFDADIRRLVDISQEQFCPRRSWRRAIDAAEANAGDRLPRSRCDVRRQRKPTERFKAFTYKELIKRDKASLDIFWLKDDSLEDSANLPNPDIIAQEIVDDLEAALEQFRLIANDLGSEAPDKMA